MASGSVIAKRYFDALNRRELDAALALWQPGAVLRVVGERELVAGDELRAWLEAAFAALPDLRFEVLTTTTQRERCGVRLRASATFVGERRLGELRPNGVRIELEGYQLLEVVDELIAGASLYVDLRDLARQLRLLPPAGSALERALTAFVNARSALARAAFWAPPEAIAAGVWVIRGGISRRMNAFLIKDADGVAVFDSGTRQMGAAIRAAAVRFGGVTRVILGHADCDHRGGAAGLEAPVYCHPLERSALRSPSPFRDYWEPGLLDAPARLAYMRLPDYWDGGPIEPAGAVVEGDDVAGFEVLHLPGHAPGLIALYREQDRLALVSDLIYTLDPQTGLGCQPRVGHPAFNLDTRQARESIRRLAELEPRAVWPGHARPLMGAQAARAALERAASEPAE